ncbi:hypothetical protein [Poseidonocella sp. HB161398]|uniref:hypothetical protein n=1 Tax=Poseidonocella sp. HB161398 TaxID=2320855 RepID=UPI001108BADB|nr:hypothetical protein [Poseidonocella sp. HB161398]
MSDLKDPWSILEDGSEAEDAPAPEADTLPFEPAPAIMPDSEATAELKSKLGYMAGQMETLEDELAATKAKLKDLSGAMLHTFVSGTGWDEKPGTSHSIDTGTHEVGFEARERVRWDGDKLREIVAENYGSTEAMPPFIREKYAVDSDLYEEMQPDVRSLFEPARSVGSGGIKITVNRTHTDDATAGGTA